MIHLQTFVDMFTSLDAKSQGLIVELTRQLCTTMSDIPVKTPPLEPLIQPWLDDLENQGKSHLTSRDYFYSVRKFLRGYPTPSPIDIDTYFTLLRGRASLQVLAFNAAALRSFFTFCEAKSLPVANLRDAVPSVKVARKRRMAASPDDVAALLSYPGLKARTKVFLLILADSGPRVSEVLTIRRSNINLEELRITIMGKGSKERIIYISPETAGVIKHYLAQVPQSRYLFPGQRLLNWSPQACRHHLAALCDKVGIKHITPHQIRHLFATRTINAGANIRSISEILGHKTPSVTLDVYCHTDEEMNKQEHAKYSPLADILSRTQIQGRKKKKPSR